MKMKLDYLIFYNKLRKSYYKLILNKKFTYCNQHSFIFFYKKCFTEKVALVETPQLVIFQLIFLTMHHIIFK